MGRSYLCQVLGLCWITSRICGVDYRATLSTCRNNDIDTSWLCRPWDVHGRDWDAATHTPRRLSGCYCSGL